MRKVFTALSFMMTTLMALSSASGATAHPSQSHPYTAFRYADKIIVTNQKWSYVIDPSATTPTLQHYGHVLIKIFGTNLWVEISKPYSLTVLTSQPRDMVYYVVAPMEDMKKASAPDGADYQAAAFAIANSETVTYPSNFCTSCAMPTHLDHESRLFLAAQGVHFSTPAADVINVAQTQPNAAQLADKAIAKNADLSTDESAEVRAFNSAAAITATISQTTAASKVTTTEAPATTAPAIEEVEQSSAVNLADVKPELQTTSPDDAYIPASDFDFQQETAAKAAKAKVTAQKTDEVPSGDDTTVVGVIHETGKEQAIVPESAVPSSDDELFPEPASWHAESAVVTDDDLSTPPLSGPKAVANNGSQK